MPAWILPEYIEDILPAEALRIEMMRRRVIDLLLSHGYELVGPPLLEYVESLLTGSGGDANLRMFKVVDQLSGRMMGLRADMTPQAARIDAHLLNRKGVARLCYAGSVLHTLPSGLTAYPRAASDRRRTIWSCRTGKRSGSSAADAPIPGNRRDRKNSH